MKLGILALVLSSFIAAGCSGEKNEARLESGNLEKTDSHIESEIHEEKIALTDEVLKEFDITVKTAGAGVIKNHIDLTGEIIVEPSRISHIIPRFNGIVKEVYKTVGDKAKEGESLALIESNESLAQYEVQSLINGTVIEMHMTQGELIGNEAHAFTIADLNRVWATFNIYQKDLGRIKTGQKALVSVGSMNIEEAGIISYVSPVVDEKTRTASARVILNNQSGKWLPGMFVSARVYINERKYPVVIEKTAVQTLENRSVVFVKDDDGKFIPRTVRTGNENDVNLEITAGLNAGNQYVSSNSFILKAEILKETFGGGHGH